MLNSEKEGSIKDIIERYFIDYEYGNKNESFVKEAFDTLFNAYPLLGYFKSYLESHLKKYLQKCPSSGSVEIDNSALNSVIESVKQYIKGFLKTSLVLGNYNTSNLV